MPNILDANGLQVATQAELYASLSSLMQTIYGPNIDLSSSTPDGQLLNIFIQIILDLEDLLMQIYNTFDPDNAIGVILDQRVAINGIQRLSGSFTITPVTVVTSTSVNLYGLDQILQPVYTISDGAGNLWQLQTTQLGLVAGTTVLNFQAALPGAIVSIPNTITVQTTVVLGVVSVNNPTTYSILGQNEESDAVLKIRRQKSVSLASQGYLAGLLAALENINGVSSAFVYENKTDTTNADGVPSHTIWVVVAGSAAASDIANAIYQKRNAGAGMFGDTTFDITQVDGSIFTVQWDSVVEQNIFISFTTTSINGINAPNIGAIRTGLVTSFTPPVYGEVNINSLATLVQAIDANTLVTNAGFSTGQTQIATLSGVAAGGTFKLNYNGNLTATINWNDAVGTIQTKVRAVAGLSTAVVTGSIASQTLTFNLTSISNIQALLYVTNNSLVTSGPVAITFAWNEGYSNTLLPSSKKFQFLVAAANIVILPMQLTPTTSTVVNTTGTVTFVGLGGYGPYIYSISVNNSGGSINSTTGVYTAGATPSTDTVKVVDVFGNSATASVIVT